jgi:hypothetical protein
MVSKPGFAVCLISNEDAPLRVISQLSEIDFPFEEVTSAFYPSARMISWKFFTLCESPIKTLSPLTYSLTT